VNDNDVARAKGRSPTNRLAAMIRADIGRGRLQVSDEYAMRIEIATALLLVERAIAEHADAPYTMLDMIEAARPEIELAASLKYRKKQAMRRWSDAWRSLRSAIATLLWANAEPTQEDFDAVQVARDIEEEGRKAEAIAFLRKHAPRCLGRKCGACGAPRGFECHGFDELGRRYDMDIPHDTRVAV
jgi:hypothetical protein